MTSFDAIIAELAKIPDWEDRYARLIALGRDMLDLHASERVDSNRVHGCASQVWLVVDESADGTLRVRGGSDALIVRGLIALLVSAYAGRSPEQILGIDALSALSRAGLQSHLSPQRANGLASMVTRINDEARRRL